MQAGQIANGKGGMMQGKVRAMGPVKGKGGMAKGKAPIGMPAPPQQYQQQHQQQPQMPQHFLACPSPQERAAAMATFMKGIGGLWGAKAYMPPYPHNPENALPGIGRHRKDGGAV